MYQLFRTERSVTVQEYKKFCRAPRFSSDMPDELIGIIHSYEFQQSIDNINRARKMPLVSRIRCYCLFPAMLLGFIIFVVGVSLVWISNKTVWIVLISTGVGIFIGMQILSCICFYLMPRNYLRLPDAVNAESMKYSTRIPIPTRWRLNVSVIPGDPINGNWEKQIIYSLIIDIGKNVNPRFRGDTSSSSQLNTSDRKFYETHIHLPI